ncbi:hypothetical protein TcYC6_0117490 [Trypanosoma cruzi]|nr:hypothetical protein TcYC6_0117490 [Trypanosoma cruzi]
MSRQELTESIEQLESDLRALDRERSGFIPCEDFKVVLLRNGGSLAQVEALTEQFKVEGRGSVRYAALLDSMKQLAGDMTSSLLARDDDDSFGRRSASRFSDESDMKKGAIAAGISHERPQPYVISQVASCAEKSANYDSHHGAFKSSGDDKRNETFYSSCASPDAREPTGILLQSSASSHRFAIPRSRFTALAANGREHKAPLLTSGDANKSEFVERPVERASFSSSRTSSVERMLQKAKECAFSRSTSQLSSGGLKKEASQEELSGRGYRGALRPPNNDSKGMMDAGKMETKGTSLKGPSAAAKTTTMIDTNRSLVQDTQLTSTSLPHNTSRVSHGTSISGLASRGGLISLREVFRLVDADQDGNVSLQEVWNAFHRRGIDISLLELAALADSLELDVSQMSDVSSTNAAAHDDRDRILNMVDFCMLVSRMRSSLIERIRRSALWVAAATEPSPPLVSSARCVTDSGRDRTDVRQRQNTEKDVATPGKPLPLMNPTSYDFMSPSQSPLSPPPPSSPPTEVMYRPKQQPLSHMDVNSFSPPPSVHTSLAFSHAIESSLASTPQGRSTAVAAVEHHLKSGSSVSVSPSPDSERPLLARVTPTRRANTSPSPHLSNAVRESEAKSFVEKQQKSVVMTASRSQSPHPYDLPIERGLQDEIELSAPMPYPQTTMNRSRIRQMSSPSVSLASSTTDAKIAGEATGLAKQDYAMLHREILARQRQRIEEEDFLRRLEQEFQEKYGDLMNENSAERTEDEPSPSPMNQPVDFSEKKPLNSVIRGAVVSNSGEARTRSSSSSLGNASPSGGEGAGNSNVGGRLLKPTASSLAHEHEKKFKYYPPRRAVSLSQGRGAIIRKTDTKDGNGNILTDTTPRRRNSNSGEEPTFMSENPQVVGKKPQQQQNSSIAASVFAHKTVPRAGVIRSVQPLVSPRNGVSARMHRNHPGGAEDGSSSDRLGGTRPGVVRVSLVPSLDGVRRRPGFPSEGARSTHEGADTSATRHNPPMPGIPPRPPTQLNASESDTSDANKTDPPELSQGILEKLYGKCSQLLSLCTNYDRSQDGFVSPKDLGRALYAVAPDLTEGEINELVRAGIINGCDGNRCHYTSLVGTLLVQESYVGLPDAVTSDEETPKKKVGAEGKKSVEMSSRAAAALSVPQPWIKEATPRVTIQSAMGNAEEFKLEERVRKGRIKMKRLLREELLGSCDGDYHRLRDAFFAYDDIRTGFIEEKVLRKCLVELFRNAKRVIPPWVMDRCVRLCRKPFEREMIDTADDENDADDDKNAPKRRKNAATAAAARVVAPPPESREEAAARRRVHGIPKLLWGVLCDYRYLLEELRL